MTSEQAIQLIGLLGECRDLLGYLLAGLGFSAGTVFFLFLGTVVFAWKGHR